MIVIAPVLQTADDGGARRVRSAAEAAQSLDFNLRECEPVQETNAVPLVTARGSRRGENAPPVPTVPPETPRVVVPH